MIDFKLLRDNPEIVSKSCELRKHNINIEELLKIDKKFRQCTEKLETLRSKRNKISSGSSQQRESGCDLKKEIALLEAEQKELEQEKKQRWELIPNILAPDTPAGDSDSDNIELKRYGTPKVTDGLAHEVIGKKFGMLDLERGTYVAGSGFYYWTGLGARLAWAVFSFTLDYLNKQGFSMFFTPVLAKDEVFFGTGYLPFFDGEIYRVEGSNLGLIGTSEQTLIGYYGNTIINESDLPIKITAFTPCFRTEAGAAGRATRGAFRVHQFHKVEQIVICRPEESEKWLQHCQDNIEELLKFLELPHRVVRVCAADLGAPAYKKFDTDTWFPGYGEFRETHSNSNLLDYQARRFKIRVRSTESLFTPHTISATGITDRAVLAIMENHVKGNEIYIPIALRPYLGGQETISLSEVK